MKYWFFFKQCNVEFGIGASDQLKIMLRDITIRNQIEKPTGTALLNGSNYKNFQIECNTQRAIERWAEKKCIEKKTGRINGHNGNTTSGQYNKWLRKKKELHIFWNWNHQNRNNFNEEKEHLNQNSITMHATYQWYTFWFIDDERHKHTHTCIMQPLGHCQRSLAPKLYYIHTCTKRR